MDVDTSKDPAPHDQGTNLLRRYAANDCALPSARPRTLSSEGFPALSGSKGAWHANAPQGADVAAKPSAPRTVSANILGYHLVITLGGGGPTSLAGTYQINNVNSGLAPDTQSAGTTRGTLAVQSTPGSGSTQSWTLVPAGSGLYKIQDVAGGLVLGIQNESTSDGGDALVWGDNGTPDHLWQFISVGNSQYKIEYSHSSLVLGVQNMSKSSSAQVLQWDDNGTADHLWTLIAR